MKLSIIYVYFNTPSELSDSIVSIKQSLDFKNFEILVIDNNSTKKIPKSVSRYNKVRVIKNKTNLGFGAACNIGAKKSKGEFLLFINPDTILLKNSVNTMIATFTKYKNVGAVGPKMIDTKGNILPTINSFLTPLKTVVVYSFLNKLFRSNPISRDFWKRDANRSKLQRVDVVSGACILIKKEVFDKVSGFDERFFMYFEEQDLCLRLKRIGYNVFFNPQSTITHYIGASLSDKKKIRKYFEESRYLYMKKHFSVGMAITCEYILKLLTVESLAVIFSVVLSLSLNLFRLNSLMLFIGDNARDFLAARDAILNTSLPLVGIPSSVPWLHQGPTSVWLIAIALFISNFNPIAPAILFGIIGAITTFLVFLLGRLIINKKVGIIASVLYASSPLIVVNARMPYHTSLIPFFTALFFLVLLKVIKKKKGYPLLLFFYGLLLTVELSNIVVIGVIFIIFWASKIKLTFKDYFLSFLAFLGGTLPFVLFELQSGPTYLKFPLWIANRLRVLLFDQSTGGSTNYLASRNTIYQQIAGAIAPSIGIISIGLFVVGIISLIYGMRKTKGRIYLITLFTWIAFPLMAFTLHAAPGTAYFTLLFPAVSILIAYLLYQIRKFDPLLPIMLTIILMVININLLISNDFFVTTKSGVKKMPPTGYSFGDSWALEDSAVKAMITDAKGQKFSIVAMGTFKLYKTSLDPFKFLIWKNGGQEVNSANLKYGVLKTNDPVDPQMRVVYEDSIDRIIKLNN